MLPLQGDTSLHTSPAIIDIIRGKFGMQSRKLQGSSTELFSHEIIGILYTEGLPVDVIYKCSGHINLRFQLYRDKD